MYADFCICYEPVDIPFLQCFQRPSRCCMFGAPSLIPPPSMVIPKAKGIAEPPSPTVECMHTSDSGATTCQRYGGGWGRAMKCSQCKTRWLWVATPRNNLDSGSWVEWAPGITASELVDIAATGVAAQPEVQLGGPGVAAQPEVQLDEPEVAAQPEVQLGAESWMAGWMAGWKSNWRAALLSIAALLIAALFGSPIGFMLLSSNWVDSEVNCECPTSSFLIAAQSDSEVHCECPTSSCSIEVASSCSIGVALD